MSWDARDSASLSSVLDVGLGVPGGSEAGLRRAVSVVRTELVVCESPHPVGPEIIGFHSFFGSNSI